MSIKKWIGCAKVGIISIYLSSDGDDAHWSSRLADVTSKKFVSNANSPRNSSLS